jgi:hypothetical protein
MHGLATNKQIRDLEVIQDANMYTKGSGGRLVRIRNARMYFDLLGEE